MNTEWLNLRSFNGDVKFGFEELVCQLARSEKISNAKFIRVAAPDGGVEAYWKLSNGVEYAWQAKYFSDVGAAQWTQLGESFRTAIEKHPRIKKYYFCLPLDRQDPRIPRTDWFMDRWNIKVREWTAYARSKGLSVKIEYWGNSEIFDRLSKVENEGKLHYWFNREEFSEEWFTEKLEESVKNLGKRYTPEINFDLPIAKLFDGLSRNKFFEAHLRSLLADLTKTFKQAVDHVKRKQVATEVDEIIKIIESVKGDFGQIDFDEIAIIDQQGLASQLNQASKLVDDLIQTFYRLDSELKQKQREEKREYVSEANTYAWDIDYFRKLEDSIYDLSNFIASKSVSLSNRPAMALVGEAGIGKSHLLADIAKKRQERGESTILILGQQFTTEDPWTQIRKILNIEASRDRFLSALNAKAETSQSRILLLIDAINEGEGKKLWKNHIAGFIAVIQRFPNLGVVFSVRTSYEQLLIPQSLITNKELVKVTHHGFADHEYEASKLFFENYEIKQPSVPLLHPEFSNPLFLKLFCEGLQKKGLHEIPEGYEGISTIINFYLEAINSSVSEKHNLPTSLNLINRVIKIFAGKIAETSNHHIEYGEAFSFLTTLSETQTVIDKAQFFQDLISEGLLTQNLFWTNDHTEIEVVYISYERFADHLIASFLIENYLNKDDPQESFKKGSKLFNIAKDNGTAFYNKGIIEALSIQLPEIINLEFYEVASHAKDFQPVAAAFVESLTWRKHHTINEKLIEYVNTIVIRKWHYHDYFLDRILLVTSNPNHFFNSDFLHRNLMRSSMADRDSWLIKFLHYRYPGDSNGGSVVKRMIDWAWTNEPRGHISNESIRLMCQTMSWFLSSPSRTLRDSTTKALICLLEERIQVVVHLIDKFKNVNDPYILQRIYAVAYGCAMRTSDAKSLGALSICVYHSVFDLREVTPDILLRDYARGIIEFAVVKGHTFDFDLSKIRPPYTSSFPKRLPTKKSLEKYRFDYNKKGFKNHYWSQNAILDSMKTNRRGEMYGDFGRYVFESAFRNWKGIDVAKLSDLAIHWIFTKYGYNVKTHGELDSIIRSQNLNREYHVEERIGKKYQWIALFEILARVSDNFPMYKDPYRDDPMPVKYEGPWNPNVRDIDPTILIKSNPAVGKETYWWSKWEYSSWDLSNEDWVFRTEDLPDPIGVIGPADSEGTQWLNLETSKSWRNLTGTGDDSWSQPHKELWYQIRSYVVKRLDYDKIINWAKKKDFMGRWMPESSSKYELFTREYYWSPSCEIFRREGYSGHTWEEIHYNETGKHIGDVSVTTLEYRWEEQFDASKESTISFYKPSELLFNLLKLKYSVSEGELLNQNGELVCFDPGASRASTSTLLIKQKDLLQVLTENDYRIFWTVLGEKQIVGTAMQPADYVGRLNISGVVYFEDGKLKHSPLFQKEQK